MDEENNSQYESESDYGSNIDEEDTFFSHTKKLPLMKRITMRRIKSLIIGNVNLSHMIWRFLIYQIIIMGPMG